MKNLVIFYSYGGNTKKIAEYIAGKIGADIVQIKLKKEYTQSYDELVDQATAFEREKACPEIKPIDVVLSNYDNIFLGTPVWWYTFTPAIRTFLRDYNLDNKNIYPFITHGGWPGHAIADIKRECKNSKVFNGVDIKFDGHTQSNPNSKLDNWLKKF